MSHMARNGVPTMMIVAQKMCRLIVKFTPIITLQFPTNTDLLASLAAANVACAALEAQLALVREYGD